LRKLSRKNIKPVALRERKALDSQAAIDWS
jgi:hypothetical protein